jgi:CO/xanthine dehydrogenase FAD-binding subunit
MAMPLCLRPRTLEEALAALDAPPAPLTVLAGGTDLYPARAAAEAWGKAPPRDFLDVSGIEGLDRIEDAGDHHRIGARVTWAALRDAPLPAAFDGLRAAAAQVGGAQVQNRATVLGNLCNASPAADGVPPLLTLDAGVEVASLRGGGVRVVPLEAFVLGNRRTALGPGEMAVAIRVPKRLMASDARSGFLKLGARTYLVISIVMVAGLLEVEAGLVARAAVAVGACSPVACRLPALESALIGQAPARLAEAVAAEHLAPLAPIDDVRASAAYRREAALVLMRRLLSELAAPAGLGRAA